MTIKSCRWDNRDRRKTREKYCNSVQTERNGGSIGEGDIRDG
jgi:hypothetical protein